MCNSPKGYGGCGMGWSVFTSSRVSRARSDSPICSFWKGAKNRAKKQVSGAIAVLRKVIVGGSIHYRTRCFMLLPRAYLLIVNYTFRTIGLDYINEQLNEVKYRVRFPREGSQRVEPFDQRGRVFR